MNPDEWKAAIVTVGDGRGFVVEGLHQQQRFVVTAAHCLPDLPPAQPMSYVHERTYPALLGPLGVAPTIAVECLFADPVADVAVLGEPDRDVYSEASDDYCGVVDVLHPLRIGILSAASMPVSLLTLEGQWESCTVRPSNPAGPARMLTLIDASAGRAAGCSGSPIIADGRVLGLVSVSSDAGQPVLASTLPLWLLSELRVDVVKARASCRAYIGVIRQALQTARESHATATTLCPMCREAVASIERTSLGVLKIHCLACGHRWSMSETKAH